MASNSELNPSNSSHTAGTVTRTKMAQRHHPELLPQVALEANGRSTGDLTLIDAGDQTQGAGKPLLEYRGHRLTAGGHEGVGAEALSAGD